MELWLYTTYCTMERLKNNKWTKYSGVECELRECDTYDDDDDMMKKCVPVCVPFTKYRCLSIVVHLVSDCWRMTVKLFTVCDSGRYRSNCQLTAYRYSCCGCSHPPVCQCHFSVYLVEHVIIIVRTKIDSLINAKHAIPSPPIHAYGLGFMHADWLQARWSIAGYPGAWRHMSRHV